MIPPRLDVPPPIVDAADPDTWPARSEVFSEEGRLFFICFSPVPPIGQFPADAVPINVQGGSGTFCFYPATAQDISLGPLPPL